MRRCRCLTDKACDNDDGNWIDFFAINIALLLYPNAVTIKFFLTFINVICRDILEQY